MPEHASRRQADENVTTAKQILAAATGRGPRTGLLHTRGSPRWSSASRPPNAAPTFCPFPVFD